MAKHDHKAIQQSFVATTPNDERSRTYTRDWLKVEENIELLLEVISGGQSLRRFCEQHQLTYSPVQRALTSPALDARYRAAQEEMAEHLMGEIERISKLIEGDVQLDAAGNPALDEEGNVIERRMDPKAGAVILDGLKWRITKLNQRRYSDRIVQENHIIDHAKLQMEAVRSLARQPRPALIDGSTGRVLDQLPAPVAEAPVGARPGELDALRVERSTISKDTKER